MPQLLVCAAGCAQTVAEQVTIVSGTVTISEANQYRRFRIRAHNSNDIGAAIERALGMFRRWHWDFVGLNAIAFPTEVLNAWLRAHAIESCEDWADAQRPRESAAQGLRRPLQCLRPGPP